MLLHVFFLDQLPPAEARAYLRSVAAIADADHRKLDALRDRVQGTSPTAVNGALVLDYGLRLARMQQERAAWALEQSGPPTPGSS